MKLALLATVLTFAGSLTGLHLTTAAGGPPPGVTASPPALTQEADCPLHERAAGAWEA